jgi:hypothetical protein
VFIFANQRPGNIKAKIGTVVGVPFRVPCSVFRVPCFEKKTSSTLPIRNIIEKHVVTLLLGVIII